MVQDNQKIACITMDIERDFSGSRSTLEGYGLFDTPNALAQLCDLLTKYQVKMTCFVVGQVLRERPDAIRMLQEAGCEFGCHSLTHNLVNPASEQEIRGGIEVFSKFFGYKPQGYRVPRGILKPSILDFLEREEIRFDSSLIASFRPGVYSNLDKPTYPFRWKGHSIVELPMSVIETIRVPISLSYMKIFSEGVFDRLGKTFGYPRPLVFLFHPNDLVYSDVCFNHLPLSWRAAYSIRRSTSWQILEKFFTGLGEKGYRFGFMSEVYAQLAKSELLEFAMHS